MMVFFRFLTEINRPFTWLVLIGWLMINTQVVKAQDVYFSPDFFPEGAGYGDLAHFQAGSAAPPGDYRADVSVNAKPVGRYDIRLIALPTGNASPCFDISQLKSLGVDVALLKIQSDERCMVIEEWVPGASATFNLQTQQLEIGVPQIAMSRQAAGYVSSDLWDRGTTAAMLGYNMNATNNAVEGKNHYSTYIGVGAGLNLGDWRFRHNGSTSWRPQTGFVYYDLNNYAQRDLTSLKSQLTLGEAFTSGELFNSMMYRGIQVATDDRMLPQSLRGYAPIIRGIARTSARVSVRQAGNVLMQTLVAPGAFIIDDLSLAGYGSDLEVVVDEADGSQQRFIIPYSPVSQLLRPGLSRYSLTVGETRNPNLDRQAVFVQATLQKSLNNIFTGAIGIQASDDYMAVLNGLAFNTSVGAMAADLMHSRTQLAGRDSQGQSLRLLYSKSLVSFGTQLTVSGHRFSEHGYHDLNSAVQAVNGPYNHPNKWQGRRPDTRYSAQLIQRLGDRGQIGLSAFTQSYWNDSQRDGQYQFSYGTQVSRVNLSFDIIRNRNKQGAVDASAWFSASMPLQWGAGSDYGQLTASLRRDPAAQLSEEMNFTSNAGENNQYSFGINGQRDHTRGDIGTAISGQYRGSSVELGSALSEGDGYRSVGLSAAGAIVAHPKGITLSSDRSDTIAVISAPGAHGAQVMGRAGLKLDSQGNAIVPHLRPYQMNDIAIDPQGMAGDIELIQSSQQAAPRAGAVLAISFATNQGQSLLLKGRLADGSPLPFGANVTHPAGHSVGIVGQGGQLYARVPEGTTQLLVQWGALNDQKCVLRVFTGTFEETSPNTREALCI